MGPKLLPVALAGLLAAAIPIAALLPQPPVEAPRPDAVSQPVDDRASGRPASEPAGQAGPPAPRRTATQFFWAAGMVLPGTGGSVQFMASNGGDANVHQQGATLDVEVAWTCGTSVDCTLQACLLGPGEPFTGPPPTCPRRLAGPSPIVHHLEGVAKGRWSAVLFDNTANVDVQGTVTFLEHAPPDPGDSA